MPKVMRTDVGYGTKGEDPVCFTYVIDGSSAKFSEKFLRPQGPKIVNNKRPQMEYVIATEAIPFLDDDDLGAE